MEIPTTTELPIFEPNQVLTSTNLNRLRTYLDLQNRLTRVRLTGTGIFCGLRVSWSPPPAGYIEVQSGYGITTEGYMLGTETLQRFRRLKRWKDPTDPNYQFGKSLPQDTLETDPVKFATPKASEAYRANVWELHNTNAEGQPVNDLFATESASDWAVVIFYEINDEDLRSCSTSNCDNKGKLRKARQRYLLVKKTELPATPFSSDDDVPTSPIALDLLNMRRLPAGVLQNASSINELYSGYQNLVIAPQKALLDDRIKKAFQQFGGVFGLDITLLNQAITALNTIESGVIYKQQVADALHHITMAYNDFAIAAGAFTSGCGYLPGNYPRHISLGLIQPPVSGADGFRNYFVSVKNPDSNGIQRNARILFNRMLRLITDFRKLAPAKSVDEIRITPGGWSPQNLSSRAIPYYYDPNANNHRIAKLWYPARASLGLWSDHLSYYNSHEPATAPSWYDSALNWSTQQNPFLRIEGFTGLPYTDVKNKLEELKKTHNLSFNVISLKLNTKYPNPGLDKLCGFEDLQEDYFIERARLLGFLNQVITYMDLFLKQSSILVDDPQSLNKFMVEVYERQEQLAKLLPTCLYQFNYEEFRDLYRKYIDEIIQFVFSIEGIQSALNSPDKKESWSETQKHAAKNMLTNIIGKLTYMLFDTLFFHRFYRIYFRYKLRELRRSKFFSFSGFATARPGLEHLSGTFQGGTFVLVYESDLGDGAPPPDEEPPIDPYSDPYPGLGINYL